VTAHTSWAVDCEGNRVVANDPRQTIICHMSASTRNPEVMADARLIAAAPDLLKHLRELVEIVDAAISAGDWKVDGCCDPSLSLDWARAAIAKAEGRA